MSYLKQGMSFYGSILLIICLLGSNGCFDGKDADRVLGIKEPAKLIDPAMNMDCISVGYSISRCQNNEVVCYRTNRALDCMNRKYLDLSKKPCRSVK